MAFVADTADLLPAPPAAAVRSRLVVDSPVGALVLTEAAGRLTALTWRRRDLPTHRAAARETAELPPDSAALLGEAADQLGDYFAGRRQSFELPLAPPGPPFQRQVWAEMCRIDYGDTASYGDLAGRVGGAARAVGQACGANPLAILIPCHRVVASDGRLGGYSGGEGTETKLALLRLEGATLL